MRRWVPISFFFLIELSSQATSSNLPLKEGSKAVVVHLPHRSQGAPPIRQVRLREEPVQPGRELAGRGHPRRGGSHPWPENPEAPGRTVRKTHPAA